MGCWRSSLEYPSGEPGLQAWMIHDPAATAPVLPVFDSCQKRMGHSVVFPIGITAARLHGLPMPHRVLWGGHGTDFAYVPTLKTTHIILTGLRCLQWKRQEVLKNEQERAGKVPKWR
jgi:hypothetical protein